MSEINYPKPMDPEARKALQGIYLDERCFMYGDTWLGTAAYYKATYPGFTDDQCRVLEMYSNGVTPKQYRNILKKYKRANNVHDRKAK